MGGNVFPYLFILVLVLFITLLLLPMVPKTIYFNLRLYMAHMETIVNSLQS